MKGLLLIWRKYSSRCGLKTAYYDSFRAARQEINSDVAGMEVQSGFEARA